MDTKRKNRWLYLLITAIVTVIVLPAVLPTTARGLDSNDPGYWEPTTVHTSKCFKHEAGESTEHGYITNNGTAVVLNTFNQDWFGDHWELLIIKAGSDQSTPEANRLYDHPQAGVAYDAPIGHNGQVKQVSHWIVCKGETPSPPTTTTLPPTTTAPPTTTTIPPTTTPPTTAPPTTVVVTTTAPPTTAPVTTQPAPTTTQRPPTTPAPTTLAPPPPTAPKALPETGPTNGNFGVFGLVLLLLGGGFLAASRARRKVS